MCGRVHIKTNLDDMLRSFAFAQRVDEVDRAANQFPRYNGAPGLDYPIIIRDVVRDAAEPVFARSSNWRGGASSPTSRRLAAKASSTSMRGERPCRRTGSSGTRIARAEP